MSGRLLDRDGEDRPIYDGSEVVLTEKSGVTGTACGWMDGRVLVRTANGEVSSVRPWDVRVTKPGGALRSLEGDRPTV
jgi:hypothetical protein